MKISYNWLKQYIDFNETPEELGQLLTSTGLEVEAIESYESVKGGLEGVVIGEVLACEKHLNADKLKVTTIDAGQTQALHIVCGAPNVAKGQKVVVALPGSTISRLKGNRFPLSQQKYEVRFLKG